MRGQPLGAGEARTETGGSQRHAFTLIEVLVVVAVIALMISILLPSLAKAREMARRSICATRLHNIALANQLYAQSNAGKIIECHGRDTQVAISPRRAASTTVLTPDLNYMYVDWQAAARKYLLDKETWECPNRPGTFGYEGQPTVAVQGYTAPDLVGKGYKVNTTALYDQWIIGYQYFGGIRTWTPWHLATQSFASRSPIDNNAKGQWALAADSIMKIDGYWGGGRPSAYGNIPPHPDGDGKPAGANVVTFDGAVLWVGRGRLVPWHAWSQSGTRQIYAYQADLGDYGKTRPPRGIP